MYRHYMSYLPKSSRSLCLSCIESPAIKTPLILILAPGVPAFIETMLSSTVMIACSLLILMQNNKNIGQCILTLISEGLICDLALLRSFRKYTFQYPDPLYFADVSIFFCKKSAFFSRNSTFTQSNSMRQRFFSSVFSF